MKKLIIFGLEQFAELANFYFTNDSEYEVVGFCVDKEYKIKDKFCNLPVFCFEDLKNNDEIYYFLAIFDNKKRADKFNYLKNNNYKMASYISTKSVCFANLIGENCFILENNTIQPFVKIGNNNVIWSGNHIGHHSIIEDHVFISSQVVISGNCHIESFCWLGVNSAIRDGLTLSENSFIAMSSMITKNTKANKKYMGVPGKEY